MDYIVIRLERKSTNKIGGSGDVRGYDYCVRKGKALVNKGGTLG